MAVLKRTIRLRQILTRLLKAKTRMRNRNGVKRSGQSLHRPLPALEQDTSVVSSFKILKEVITPEQAKSFVVGYCKFTDPVISDLVEMVRAEYPDISAGNAAYVRVEDRLEGHPWHRDTGSTGHMSWCYVSARMLLSPEGTFNGGGFYFRDDPETPHYGYRDLMMYSSADTEHMVGSHSGERKVLLMFFEKSPT